MVPVRSLSLQPSSLQLLLLRAGGDRWWTEVLSSGPCCPVTVSKVSFQSDGGHWEPPEQQEGSCVPDLSLHPALQEHLLTSRFGFDWSHQLVELRDQLSLLQTLRRLRGQGPEGLNVCVKYFISLFNTIKKKPSQNCVLALWFWALERTEEAEG